MIRMSQGLHKELADLGVANAPGEIVYETAFFHLGDRVLCVAAPQSKRDEVFLAVTQCTEERFDAAFFGEIVHDVLGVPDDVVVWVTDIPARRGIPLSLARLHEAQGFTTRESVWEEGEDDAGAPIPPDLGDRDLGEHGVTDPVTPDGDDRDA